MATATDNFNRADGAIGGSWVSGDFDLRIASNQVTGEAGFGRGNVIATAVTADQYQKIEYRSGENSDNQWNLKFRTIPEGSDEGGNGYQLTLSFASDLWIFHRVDAWSETEIRTSIALATPVAGDIYEARMIGSVLSAYLNGVLVGSSNVDTTYTAVGKIGMASYGAATTVLFDNWEGGDFVAGGPSANSRSLMGVGL